MSENLTPQADAVNDITLTVADMKSLGFNDVVELQAKLKQAAQTAAEKPTIDRITDALVKASENMNAAAQAMRENKGREISDHVFETLTQEEMVKQFKSLPAGDPSRKAIFDELSSEYGFKNTMLVLEGSELKKALERPISQKNPQFEEITHIRKAYDLAYVYTAAKQKVFQGETEEGVEIDLKSFHKSLDRLEKEGLQGVESVRKGMGDAMDTQTATEGAEWLPVGMSADMVADVYLELRLAALFRRYIMPTKSYDVPVRSARGYGYRMSEATAPSQFFQMLATAHSMETGKINFTAEKLASLQFLSDELEQDNILPILEMIREDCIWGMSTSIENAILNGSTSLSDLDNAGSDASRLWNNTTDAGDGIRFATGALDTRNSWDGLRKLTTTGAKVDFGNVAVTLAKLRDLRKPMDKYSVEVADLAYVLGARTHIDLLNLSEVVTLEKYGPNATVLQGEIGRIDGVPLVISQHVYTYLNASGVFNTATPGTSPSNRTIMMLVNRKGFAFGDRQLIRVEADRQPLSGLRYVLATWRGDFQKIFPSSEPVAALGYNMTI